MGEVEVNKVINLVPDILNLMQNKIWTLYDKEADVLYIDFTKPNIADDSEIAEDDVILRYAKDELIGITVLNASKVKREK